MAGAGKKPRGRVTTMSGLAKRLGLSPTTVSFVLNGQAEQRKIAPETATRVLDAAAEWDYVPNALARGLRQKRTHAIGVVFPHLRGDWAHRITQGMIDVLRPIGSVPLIVCHYGSDEQEDRLLRSLVERRVDGIICNPLQAGSPRYRQVIARGMPLVFLGDCPSDMGAACFAGWDPAAVETAVRYLLDLGHRRIGYLGVQDDRVLSYARFRRFHDTIVGAGLEWRPRRVILNPPGASFEGEVMQMLAEPDPPTAFFALYDDIAMGALSFLSAAGVRVPQDVSIATIGSPPVTAPGYQLTTVTAPVEEEGRACAECLMSLISNPAQPPIRRLVEGGELVAGHSTGPAPR